MRHSDPFVRLKRSKFRRTMFLDEKEKEIFYVYGEDIIKEHARKIVSEMLAKPATEMDDGHQTPKRGHPVFKAMHATATCCRKCLFKWHRIPRYRHLEMHEIDFIVNMIAAWINAKVAC